MTDLLRDEIASLNPIDPAEVGDIAIPDHVRAAILAEVRAAPGGRPRRPRRRFFPLAFAGLLVVASGAVAAAVALHTGRPAPKSIGLELGRWANGPGAPVAGSARLLSLRAADPDGGPPWGLRVFRTQRGAECWQVGRVLNGRLGVIGRDGLMNNDGLFHPLHWQADDCRPLDGAGHLFAYQESDALANGNEVGSVVNMTCSPNVDFDDKFPRCPAPDRRYLWFGFLGPQARSVSMDGGPATPVTAADDRAFLHVEYVRDEMHLQQRRFNVTYADGTTRPPQDVEGFETPAGLNTPAPPPGFVSPERLLPSAAKVRSPIRVTTHRYGTNQIYRVQFRSRVARRYGADYRVELDGPGSGSTCSRPLHFSGFSPTAGAGHTATVNISPAIDGRWNQGWCPGTYRGRVVLHDRAHTVGTFTFRVRD